LAIKPALLIQKGFPGVGNWMADEILWRARINPHLTAAKLNAAQLRTLWTVVRFVCRQAVRRIGNDFSDPPKNWLFHQRWSAQGRCPRDGQPLVRETIGGRTTAWCPRCQPRNAKAQGVTLRQVRAT
jgi:formamidopyrimidine-DNA glycosylase